MNFTLSAWNQNLDLTKFYLEAARRGFVNNSNQKSMIDCFRNEKKWAAWILFKDEQAIGSVAAHSFDDIMGENSFRILTRVCSFPEYSPNKGLITKQKLIKQHQNFTDQFFFPKCVEWAGRNNHLYATSNPSSEASQRLVHSYYFPSLEEKRLVEKVQNIFYRGLEQTVWKFNTDLFELDLDRYPRW